MQRYFAALFCTSWMVVFTFHSSLSYSAEVYRREHISSVSIPNSKQLKSVISDECLEGIFRFVVQQRVFYRGFRRVYLLRDGELMYDMDWLLWSKNLAEYEEPEPSFVNLSRLNIKDPLVDEYLRQQGLLGVDSNIVLLDTGFEGSIINFINQKRSELKLEPLRSHLISSSHPDSASSRVATSPYVAKSRYKANSIDKEEFLDLVDQQIDDIEDSPKENQSSDSFVRIGNIVHPTSSGKVEQGEMKDSLLVRGKLVQFLKSKKKFQESSEISSVLYPLVESLSAQEEKVVSFSENLKDISTFLEEKSWYWMWQDLREVAVKGRRDFNRKNLTLLWQHLGFESEGPVFFDLEESQLREVLSREGMGKREERTSSHLQKKSQTLIEYLIENRKKFESREKDLTMAFKELKKIMKRRSLILEDIEYPISKEKIGEGVRSDVYQLGDQYVLKTAYEASDIPYLAVEIALDHLLQTSLQAYELPILKILYSDPLGSYIVRELIPADSIGSNTPIKKMSKKQLFSLRVLFEKVKHFARETGVGLDIKADNIAWINRQWVIFDLGPRTSYGPYAFSLDLENFEEFVENFEKDAPRKNGKSIQSVVAKAKKIEITCEPKIFL